MGTSTAVSDSVLDAIAGALRLDEAERTHLFDLAKTAGTSPSRARRRTPQPRVRPSLRAMLGAI